jgi:hypothetical protein
VAWRKSTTGPGSGWLISKLNQNRSMENGHALQTEIRQMNAEPAQLVPGQARRWLARLRNEKAGLTKLSTAIGQEFRL